MTTLLQPGLRHLTFDEVTRKYPEVPRLIILKTDVQRRGVHYTQAALATLNPEQHQIIGTHIFGARDGKLESRPESLLLRDGTSIITTPTPLDQNPYIVDRIDGRLVLTEQGKIVEEVDYWPRPDFYASQTAEGTEMRFVVTARPKRLSIFPYRYCQFWNEAQGCLFCDIVPQLKQGKDKGIPARLAPEEVGNVVAEALKEPGRFTGICLTGGSVLGGDEPFDREVDYYIKVLQSIGKHLKGRRFTSQLISTAFNDKQLRRLHDETGLSSYTADIEVLNEALFNWICPGKAKWVGYQEWKRRLTTAAKIFGPGNVNTGIVAGVELARPHGFTSEDEALAATLSEAEDLARQGVSTVFIVWSPRPNSAFGGQTNSSLEYYIRLAKGLHALRVKYGLSVDFDDFRNCGNHPDTDLSRVQEVATGESASSPVTVGNVVTELIRQPTSTVALATSDEKGVPEVVIGAWVKLEHGKFVYLEPLQASTTNRNLTHSLWFNRPVALTVQGKNGNRWQIKGLPVKAHICGPVFRKHYEQIRQEVGETDLAAVWLIEPREITNETLAIRRAEHDAFHPAFRHLDQLLKTEGS